MQSKLRGSALFSLFILATLAILPPLAFITGHPFWLDIFTRLVILAIAATGLNLILGYGGLVSFGHAAYIGLGAYAVGVPVYHETYGGFDLIASYSGFVHLGLALLVSAAFALITGVICLRTRGVNFIMITMAFGQMIFYAIVSLETYGGDDGLTIDLRSEFPLISLDNPLTLYTVCYLSLVGIVFLIYRLSNSRFGLTLQGTRSNEERMRAIGVDTYRYQLLAFVISGVICGYAGFLLGNFTTFISPEMLDWTRSGEIMFMVILGGATFLCGPIVGAILFIVLEHLLSEITVFWHLPFGLLLIFSVLFLPGGIVGAVSRIGTKRDSANG
ncbi:ABC transporter permease [Chromatiales bacterium (ex Bugula neritina AB1)]|nr:ABC transporter permease [Chromatiales bacterium (ex Bugula neritina AB1)]